MRLPRDVSGERLVEALCRRWRYSTAHQSGSHIIIETGEPSHQRIAVPNHNTLRIGTLNSILRAVSNHKGATRDEIVATLRQIGGANDCGEVKYPARSLLTSASAQEMPSREPGVVYYADGSNFKPLAKEAAPASGRAKFSAKIKGAHAAVRFREGHPLRFRLCSADPTRYKVYRLRSTKNSRDVTIAKVNIWIGGGKSALSESEIPFTVEPADSSCFTLTNKAPLNEGEYAVSPPVKNTLLRSKLEKCHGENSVAVAKLKLCDCVRKNWCEYLCCIHRTLAPQRRRSHGLRRALLMFAAQIVTDGSFFTMLASSDSFASSSAWIANSCATVGNSRRNSPGIRRLRDSLTATGTENACSSFVPRWHRKQPKRGQIYEMPMFRPGDYLQQWFEADDDDSNSRRSCAVDWSVSPPCSIRALISWRSRVCANFWSRRVRLEPFCALFGVCLIRVQQPWTIWKQRSFQRVCHCMIKAHLTSFGRGDLSPGHKRHQ